MSSLLLLGVALHSACRCRCVGCCEIQCLNERRKWENGLSSCLASRLRSELNNLGYWMCKLRSTKCKNNWCYEHKSSPGKTFRNLNHVLSAWWSRTMSCLWATPQLRSPLLTKSGQWHIQCPCLLDICEQLTPKMKTMFPSGCCPIGHHFNLCIICSKRFHCWRDSTIRIVLVIRVIVR